MDRPASRRYTVLLMGPPRASRCRPQSVIRYTDRGIVALSDTDKVDLVTKPLPGNDCKLVLYVVDEGGIADPLRRYQVLVQKLTAYVTYVGSDGFRRSNPGVGFPDVLVRVLHTTPPIEAMTDIQAVGAKGEAGQRCKVVFEDYNAFRGRLGSV